MSFTARYFSDCAYCDERIQPGQEAAYTAAGELVHVPCPEATVYAVQSVCPHCQLEHAGECF